MWTSVERSEESASPLATMRSWLKVSEAAKYLGVTSKTLRNWDSSGKLKARRHPINGYRLYRRDDLDRFLDEVENGQCRRQAAKPGRSEDEPTRDPNV